MADVASARASVAATVERFGRIDSLVSAAGLTTGGAPGTIVNIITMYEHGGQPYLAPMWPPRPAWPG